jgi:hypothetical protein
MAGFAERASLDADQSSEEWFARRSRILAEIVDFF